MSYNYVTVSGTFATLTGTVTFTPPDDVTDLTGAVPVLGPAPAVCTVSGGSFTSPALLGTDNVGLLPAGWSYLATVALTGQKAYSYPVLVPAANGTTATLSALPVSASGGGNTEGFNNPMTTLGDVISGGASGAATRLAGNTSGTRKFFTQTGTGSASTAPAWGTIASADMPAGTTSAQGALQLDGSASSIQALGTGAAGTGTLAAISTHIHPSPALNPAATDQGYKAWTMDPIASISAVPPTAGVLYLARIVVQSTITAGTVSTFATGAASGVTSQAATFVALFNSTGTIRYGVSSDISASFGSTGLVSASIGTVATLTPGYYYTGFLMGTAATTTSKLPAFAGGVNVPGYPSLNLTASTGRWASQGTGLVAMPGTVNMASNSLTMNSLNTYFWFAIS